MHRRREIHRQHSHQSLPPLSGNQSQPSNVFKTTGRCLQRPLSLHQWSTALRKGWRSFVSGTWQPIRATCISFASVSHICYHPLSLGLMSCIKCLSHQSSLSMQSKSGRKMHMIRGWPCSKKWYVRFLNLSPYILMASSVWQILCTFYTPWEACLHCRLSCKAQGLCYVFHSGNCLRSSRVGVSWP